MRYPPGHYSRNKSRRDKQEHKCPENGRRPPHTRRQCTPEEQPNGEEKELPGLHDPWKAWRNALLRAGATDHLNVGRFETSVFVVGLLHPGVVRHVLGVFFHVMHLRVGHDAGYRHRMAHVLGQRSGVAAYRPTAAVIGLQQKFVVVRRFLQAARDGASVAPSDVR